MAGQREQYLRLLLKVFTALLVLLAFRVLAGIVYQYQWYFPPNFQASGFLAGRETFFHGSYGFAFYSHIVCGPFAILIAMFLFWSGRRNFRIGIHRCLGKVQFLLVVIVLVPSGLVMATRAYTGFIAGAGFALLSIMTSAAAILSVVYVKHGDLLQHRRWSSRLFILLLSPIVLRITSGFIVTLGIESRASYQFNAWATFICPNLPDTDSDFASTHYAFSIGDVAKKVHSPNAIRGAFAVGRTQALDEITDGTSNTIGLAEIGGFSDRSTGRRFAINQPTKYLENPSLVSELVDNSSKYLPSVELSETHRGGKCNLI